MRVRACSFLPGTPKKLIGQHRRQGMFKKPSPQIISFYAANSIAEIVFLLAPMVTAGESISAIVGCLFERTFRADQGR